MKKTLFLHIGMGKTGTTSLQHFFWENRGLMDESGICYPEYATAAHAHHLVSPYIPKNLDDSWGFMSVEEWAPVIASVQQPSVLLSSELIASTPRDAVDAFCAGIGRWFDLRVIIYLRRQDNLIMSSYLQQVKSGRQKRRIQSVVRRQQVNIDYLQILEPWENSLGAGNIIVRPYEEQQFHAGDIRKDFMHVALNAPLNSRYKFTTGNPNPSLWGVLTTFKLLINNLISSKETHARFNELLGECSVDDELAAFSNYAILSPRERLEIIEAAEPINSAIARKYLGRNDGKLFLEPLPDIEEEWFDGVSNIQELQQLSCLLLAKDAPLIKTLGQNARHFLDTAESRQLLAAQVIVDVLDTVLEE